MAEEEARAGVPANQTEAEEMRPAPGLLVWAASATEPSDAASASHVTSTDTPQGPSSMSSRDSKQQQRGDRAASSADSLLPTSTHPYHPHSGLRESRVGVGSDKRPSRRYRPRGAAAAALLVDDAVYELEVLKTRTRRSICRTPKA